MMKKLRDSFIARILIAAMAVAAAPAALMQSFAQEPSGSSAVFVGNAAAGKAVFESQENCVSCHRAGATGAFYGPNLSNVGSRISPAGLRILLNTPPEKATPANRHYEIVLNNGKTVRGKLLNQDPFSLQLLSLDGQLVAFKRSQIRSGKFVDPPQMPSFKGTLTDKQIADLVAYLTTLRTPEN
jgi:putative heme-binding domain-containing protein